MQTIYLDISNKGVIPCIQAKQSEVGRKFLAVITDNGVPYNIPSNSLLSVWYEGDTDAGNYSSIEEKSAFSVDGNKVTVELVAQMLLRPGKGELCLSVTHGDGGETNTWNIPDCVEYKPGAGSTVPTEYYTALTEAGSVAARYATDAKAEADRAESLVNGISTFEEISLVLSESVSDGRVIYKQNLIVEKYDVLVSFGAEGLSAGEHNLGTFSQNVPNCAFPVVGNQGTQNAYIYVRDNIMILVLPSGGKNYEWWTGRVAL